ncbi:MAG: NAD(P)/FAD-dependent oxidoreductase [Pseudomonadales bacterium]
MNDENTCDVVVVGAGAAGLWAAVTLRDAGKSVVVLEANDRVGGRLKRGMLDNEVIDLGGQWAGPGQDFTYKVATRYGVGTFLTPTTGKQLLEIDGEMHTEEDAGVFNNVVASSHDIVELWSEKMRDPVFWEGGEPLVWDKKTLEAWLIDTVEDARIRGYLTSTTQALFAVHPCQISMLDFFGSFVEHTIEKAISRTDGDLKECFHGGLHQITTHMAADLGESVILETPVRAITQNARSVTVVADKGVWQAQRVIVASPPPMASRIDFTPALPFQKSGYMDRMPMGNVIKCLLAYSSPFWRDQGYSGHVATTSGVIDSISDVTPPGYNGGILVAFLGGHNAMAWSDTTTTERRQRVVEGVAQLLGPDALEPRDYIDNVWTLEPWILGGYSCIPVPGTYGIFGDSLSDPCGRIHWASTETAEKNGGYVDGALRSGERAANEVLAEICQ